MTDQDVAALFERLGVLRGGHFRLSSGRHSDTYLQCALALQHPHVALDLGSALAGRVRDRTPDVVASPAVGGILAGFAVAAALGRRFVFAERADRPGMALRRGQVVEEGDRVLVVEDVVTTGGSAAEVAALCARRGATVVGVAALVDRSGGLPAEERPAQPVTALLAVAAGAWTPPECPLCARGLPLESPGSRPGRPGGPGRR
ncbi:MAG: orotate phosphoribosyltransferase [Actinobacteria bacterium]|nr:orotate phosphoribosyltransferase [Actinomycetota bacterium]